jgi:hypothetical protein
MSFRLNRRALCQRDPTVVRFDRRLSGDNHRSGGCMVVDKERRKGDESQIVNALKRELNDEQRIALADLERFGWELKFIRRPMFQESVPVVFDPDRTHYAVLEKDGSLNEKPGFDIRK